MAVICAICASPSLRARVDADVVRRQTLSSIAQEHGLSSRAVRRHRSLARGTPTRRREGWWGMNKPTKQRRHDV
jgi:hypothetical protein